MRNMVNEESSFITYESVLIAHYVQYDIGYMSNFDGSNIYPGVSKDGYLLFEDVPEDIIGEAKLIAGYSYGDWFEKEYYKFNINGKFYFQDMDFQLHPGDRIALLVPLAAG